MITLKNGLQVAFRPFRDGDEPLIFSTWCHQVRKQTPFRFMDPEEFRKHKKVTLEPVVNPESTIVACHPEHEFQAFGYVVRGPEALYFLYVKGPYRNWGLGTALMKKAFPNFLQSKVYFTHKTAAIRHLLEKWKLQWDPYAI